MHMAFQQSANGRQKQEQEQGKQLMSAKDSNVFTNWQESRSHAPLPVTEHGLMIVVIDVKMVCKGTRGSVAYTCSCGCSLDSALLISMHMASLNT
jgi:hypothetical protein